MLAALGTRASGLDGDDAEARRRQHGPNVLRESVPEPTWRRVARLACDPLTIVLLVAAATSAAVSGEVETPVVILAVVVFNAVLNLVQEHRAEESVRALARMTSTQARAIRDGRPVVVDGADLVPGDLVAIEAGDVVPADGRIVEATSLEVEEAALTGESTPVAKQAEAEVAVDAPVADRATMVFMTTPVTRGRATFVVTTTGMATEVGRIAALLDATTRDRTPLQRQIDGLARALTGIVLVVIAIVFTLGVLRGQDLSRLFLTSVSLAVATIPEGLSAVVAFTLAMGASRLAKQRAIIKNLAAVETLGGIGHICADKTGTLTLNQMTAKYLFAKQRLFEATGDGYRTDGALRATNRGTDGGELPEPVSPPPDVGDALLAMAMCSDASVHDGVLVGDPTEGALVVLAAKGGVDAEEARAAWPRVAEVPFDSEHKYMATFHRCADTGAGGLARVMVKGAPDVVLARCTELDTPDRPIAIDGATRARLERLTAWIAARGLRVMAFACRDVDGVDDGVAEETLRDRIADLRLLAFVAIEDPPRPEAREAVAAARAAGIAVHMITGDHIGTASAIAAKIGIEGEALSGADLDALDDEALADRAPTIGVLARVSPEHKLRTIRALQRRGATVAMTGDGVNDAPALKQANIGVAMGITGSDVSKGAATMILTDDNFATIVAAIRQGRGIYANIVKFVKFQLSTAWAFVMIFLAAAVFGWAGGAPFTALQVLWANIIMDGPPALALGVDPTPDDVMTRPPRHPGERLLTRPRVLRILLASAVMTIGTLAVLAIGSPTLVFTTFVFFQAFNLLNVRAESQSVFSRYSLTNRWIWVSLAVILVLQGLVVHVGALQAFFETTDLTVSEWLVAAAVGSSVLWVEEARKTVARTWRRRAAVATPARGISSPDAAALARAARA